LAIKHYSLFAVGQEARKDVESIALNTHLFVFKYNTIMPYTVKGRADIKEYSSYLVTIIESFCIFYG
jgi:hypothetical protein